MNKRLWDRNSFVPFRAEFERQLDEIRVKITNRLAKHRCQSTVMSRLSRLFLKEVKMSIVGFLWCVLALADFYK